MKKSRGETIDLTYSGPNKKKVKNKKSKEGKSKKNDNRINLNNEIIIGLTPKKEEKKNKEKAIKKDLSKKPARKPASKKSSSTKKKTKKVVSEQVRNRKAAHFKIFKWVSITVLIATCIIIFMLSSIFNISEIRVAR